MKFALPFLFPYDDRELVRLRNRGTTPMDILRDDYEFQRRTIELCGDALSDDETVLMEIA